MPISNHKNSIRLYPFVVILFLFSCCRNSSSSNRNTPLSGNIKTDLDNLLPDGKVSVDIMDYLKQNPNQAALDRKLQIAIQEHGEWFAEYTKTIPKGQPMPYHKNLGLTESEYTAYQAYLKETELTSSGKADVTIKKSRNTIQFTAKGKLQFLNSVKIDFKNNLVYFGENELPFSDTLNVKSNENWLKSRWKGYRWVFDGSKNLGEIAISDLQSLNYEYYTFSIGRLEKNGKTFIDIQGQKVEKGTSKNPIELQLMF